MFIQCLPFLYRQKPVAKTNPTIEEDPCPIVEELKLRIPESLMYIENPNIKAQLKKFCKDNNLCVACSYANPESPTILVYNHPVYECPTCDSDEDSP